MGNSRITSWKARWRKQIVCLAGLLIVLLALLVRALVRGPADAAANAVLPSRAAETVTATQVLPVHVAVDWTVESVRDPFRSERVFPSTRPVQTSGDAASSEPARDVEAVIKQAHAQITLHGTMLSNPPLAMINDSAYRVGVVVAGFRITKIEANRVTIEGQGVRLLVTVKKP